MSYDLWKMDNDSMYNENPLKPDDYEHVKDYMDGILKILYGKDPIDVRLLEEYLGEVCAVVDIRLPKSELKIHGGT
jgi:hypothetical protein